MNFDNNYTEYRSDCEKNKHLSINEYLDNTKSYLKYRKNNLEKTDTWKIHIAMAINYISVHPNL